MKITYWVCLSTLTLAFACDDSTTTLPPASAGYEGGMESLERY